MKKRDPKTGRYVKLTADDIPAAQPQPSEFVRKGMNFFERIEHVAGDRFNEVKVLRQPDGKRLGIAYYPARVEAAIFVIAEMIADGVPR